MSWFKRKDAPQIPEPTPSLSQPNVLRRGDRDPSPNPPSYRTSNANTYNRSRDGDPYAADLKSGGYNNQPTGTYQTGQDRYARSAGVGDPYSRAGAGNLDADRNELFSGYNPERSAGQNRFANRPGESGSGRFGGWQDRTPANQEEQDEDVERIKADTRQLKNDSLQSSRNALRLAREAEETARLTLNKLGDQSGKQAFQEFEYPILTKTPRFTSQRKLLLPSATSTNPNPTLPVLKIEPLKSSSSIALSLSLSSPGTRRANGRSRRCVMPNDARQNRRSVMVP